MRPVIEKTLEAFASACNRACEAACEARTSNKVRLQHLVYRELRARFGLSSNLAIRAIARVTAALKGRGKRPTFRPSSIDFDQRIFSLRESDWTVSLTLLGGRHRFKIHIGEHQRQMLTGRHPHSAKLVKQRNGRLYLHIAIQVDPEPMREPAWFLGIDLGIRNVASLSTGERFGGGDTDFIRNHYQTLKSALQRKGTKGAKRLLKRLSGREHRYMTWLNHTISARMVRFARLHQAAIVLEDLTGIRNRTRVRKEQRRRHHQWSFSQLRSFLNYKSIRDGIKLVVVRPDYTSKTCHRCLHIGRRMQDVFSCRHCGYQGHADYNGACTISRVGASVTRPEHLLSCQLVR